MFLLTHAFFYLCSGDDALHGTGIKLGLRQQHITHETLEKTQKINFAIFASFRGQL